MTLLSSSSSAVRLQVGMAPGEPYPWLGPTPSLVRADLILDPDPDLNSSPNSNPNQAVWALANLASVHEANLRLELALALALALT